MRKINKMMAIAMLAVMVSLGTQTAFATSGVLLSDRQMNNGHDVKTPSLIDYMVTYLKTGVILSDRDSIILSD